MFFYNEQINIIPLVLTSSVDTMSFSDTSIVGSSSQTFTVSAGGGSTTENIMITNSSSQFNISPSSFNLSNGGSQIVTVNFVPTSIGIKTTTLSISASRGSTKNVSIQGSGIATTWEQLSSSVQSPSWFYTTENQDLRTNWFSLFSSSADTIYNTITSSNTAINSDGSKASTYLGGVLMRDGRVFCVPAEATYAIIYNPSTNSITAVGSFPGNYAFSEGCLMKDGRVYLAPYNTTAARIYDPTTNTFTIPSGTFPGNYNHIGAILLPNGKIFINSTSGLNAKIYDPDANTLSNANCTISGNSVLMRNGKIFIFRTGQAGIYDPLTDTTTLTSGSFPSGLSRPINLPDGRIYIAPFNATTARIYNPTTDSISTPSGTFPVGVQAGYHAFSGAVAMADGRVFIVPYHNQYARIYDPKTDTLLTTSAGYASLGWNGGVLLKNNKVFLVPFAAPTGQIYSGRVTTLDDSFVLSPFVNS
jgi:hypothetical protein